MNEYSDIIEVKSHMCDKFGLLRYVSLMNILQNLASEHSNLLNIGSSFCKEHNVGWVVIYYYVDILKKIKERNKLFCKTWLYSFEKLKTVREFQICDKNGDILINATSQWVLIDLEKRRPILLDSIINLDDDVKKENRAINKDFNKIENFIENNTCMFDCKFDDFDINQHINNSVYMNWAIESLGLEFMNKNYLKTFYINFKKEITTNIKKVCVGVKLDKQISYHKIKSNDVDNVIIKCFWKTR